MASTTTAPPRAACAGPHPVSVQRHVAWLVGGMAGAFLVPFVLADRLGLQRDVYYGLYAAAVVALFVAWARDTRQPLRAMLERRRTLAIGLGHVHDALQAGATHEQITETIGVSIMMGGGPAAIYGAEALDALRDFEAHPMS